MDMKNIALASYTDNLNFYRLCANIAAALTIIIGVIYLIVQIYSFHGIALEWVMIAASFGTTVLLIGRYFFPRVCAVLLLAKFHFSNAYLALCGVEVNPWFTLISSTFFVMGCVESIQSARVKNGLNSFWLAAPQVRPTLCIVLTGTFLAMISSGFLYRLFH
ncbi:hypothetical protein LVQ79_22085 [Buttiauxella sp. A2-C1_F]|uniref:hypothetical protein n=1 Tax=unclassified Buttiauxella TaxID=2634062 RepID=UPI001E63BB2C|nr:MULTISPECIES: hypothetical protein [unclassified Buttiauxella]MCE0800650.1 hypothetical protein [Buttiauxella sp. W03-F01]MCE0814875.1 hypothetical protein [Buttiauxella sp. S04-F03]MCE0848221.1 hypothetical protein [Buttiauxella sp. A2-C1_F]